MTHSEAIADKTRDQPIPVKCNIAIFLVCLPLTWGLLWMGSHLAWGWVLLAAWLFALLNNTVFGLLHEAVHGGFSPNRCANEFFGVLCALTLPTSFVMQRMAHLGHHQRNRSDAELFDYYLPNQTKRQRDFVLYGGNLLGLYWFCLPLNVLIYVFAPWLYRSPRFIQSAAVRRFSFEPFVRDIASSSQPVRIWLECLLALLYQIALWWCLDLNWLGWLICHWAFALHWSALQYVDHADSPRHVIDGAWNLKVLPFSRALALNYHYHLAHHQHPSVPWLYLPAYVDPRRGQPTFWSIYFDLWRNGTRPAPPMSS